MSEWLAKALHVADACMSLCLGAIAIYAVADGQPVIAAFFAANAGLAARRFLADE